MVHCVVFRHHTMQTRSATRKMVRETQQNISRLMESIERTDALINNEVYGVLKFVDLPTTEQNFVSLIKGILSSELETFVFFYEKNISLYSQTEKEFSAQCKRILRKLKDFDYSFLLTL